MQPIALVKAGARVKDIEDIEAQKRDLLLICSLVRSTDYCGICHLAYSVGERMAFAKW